MEIRFTMTEADLVKASALWSKGWKRTLGRIFPLFLLSIFLLQTILALLKPSDDGSDVLTEVMLKQAAPILTVVVLWIFFAYFLIPMTARRAYRKNLWMRSEMVASVTPEAFSLQLESGFSRFEWRAFKYWREGNGLIVFGHTSNTYNVINVSGLSDMERYELRSILKAALPKKK